MKTRAVYLLFSSTGTWLARTIDLYTKQSLNHVSISLDQSLSHVYSFGRKRPRNPFIGGFVKENLNSPLFNQTSSAIYKLEVTEQQYQQLRDKLLLMESQQDLYRYNFLGLLGVMVNIELHRDNTYFCSQFVASLLKESGVYHSHKPLGLIRPQDLRTWDQLQLIYQGEITQFPSFNYQPEEYGLSSTHQMFSYYYYYMNQKMRSGIRKTRGYFRL